MSNKNKSEALKKHLGNNIGYCPKCEKKHEKGKHDPGATKENHKNNSEERAEKEVEKEEEEE